jgi:RNA polymerase sigma-70 factor (ECF subfamily)
MNNDDVLLLQRFRDGEDAEAFSEIVSLYAGVVYGACKRIISDSEQARDIAQDTFFQLFKNADKINGSLASWLHSVATHRAIDVVRRNSARKKREAQYSKGKIYEAQKWDDISPYIDEALDHLDDELRQILVKHFLEGLTMRETADDMGCSHATISRKVYKGLESLRAVLKKRGIIVAAISLGGLMTQNAAQAAPAVLITELGKMSLAAGTLATAKATAATVMTTVKAKVVTAAAIAAISTGAVVTYNNVKKTPAPENQAAVTVAAEDNTAPANKRRTNKSSDTSRVQQWQAFWDEIEAEQREYKSTAAVDATAEYQQPKQQSPKPTIDSESFHATIRKPVARRAVSTRSRRTVDPNEQDQMPRYGGGRSGTRSSRRPVTIPTQPNNSQ